MVGLNPSRPITEPFRNFHDLNPRANDFKLRHAFTGTDYWGAYMTDIIKDVVVVPSTDLRAHVKGQRAIIQGNVEAFLQELKDLNAVNATILALGSDAYQLITAWVPPAAYRRLMRLTHYSRRVSKEDYRTTVLREVAAEAMPLVEQLRRVSGAESRPELVCDIRHPRRA
jgi:hypothetical protein